MQLCGVGRFTLVMVGLAFLPGCRTLNLTNPNRVDAPGSAQRRLSPMATEMVQKWSDNAAKVKTLKAQPTVKLTAVDGRRRFTGGVSGRLAMERPKNFKLDLSTNFGQVADIGSNDQMIWFWIKDGTDGVYVARYTEDGRPSARLNIDPQWVLEAMGLAELTPAQIAKLDIRRDPTTRNMIFTEHRDGPSGERWIKETEMDAGGDIVAHRLLEDDARKTLIASADIEGWQTVMIPKAADDLPTLGGAKEADSVGEDQVLLPEKIKLFWAMDQLAIEVRMHSPQVNVPFNDDFRQAQFKPPEKRGQSIVDISDKTMLAAGRRDQPSAMGRAGSRDLAASPRAADPPPLARLREPEPLKAPEIPSTLPSDPVPESILPKRIGPVNPSLNVSPSAAVGSVQEKTVARRSLPRPQ